MKVHLEPLLERNFQKSKHIRTFYFLVYISILDDTFFSFLFSFRVCFEDFLKDNAQALMAGFVMDLYRHHMEHAHHF